MDAKTNQEEIEEIRQADASVKKMEDFTSPDKLYQELIASIRKYHPSDDISMIEKAYRIAYEAHKGQKRKSGEPYIIHPLCVAIILADLELDKETIVAGLLHDVVEDTVMTSEEVRQEFGAEVELLLVDGVTKLTQLYLCQRIRSRYRQKICGKMFLAMAKDIRVILDQAGRPSPQYAYSQSTGRRRSRRRRRVRRWISMRRSRTVLVFPRSKSSWMTCL